MRVLNIIIQIMISDDESMSSTSSKNSRKPKNIVDAVERFVKRVRSLIELK